MVIRNFLFHRVSDETDAMWPPMKVALFKKIIRHLTENFLVVPLEHYLNDPGAFQTKRKIATVLFDDGYKDNIEFAAPVLAQYKCPASFYVVTDCIDRNIPTWTYLVDSALAGTAKQVIELAFDFVPEKFRKLDIKRNPLIKEIKPWMKKLSNPERLHIMQSILEQCNDVETKGAMMSWDEIRQLKQHGFIIGSHSHTHPMLASLQNESEISDELRISAKRILEETGNLPQTISYPIGSFDDRVVRLSKENGYTYGLAVEQQFYRPDKDDIFKYCNSYS
ncbi:MAG: polysaccharide deacetylase family protein [Bacteroidota bacterium]